MVLEAILQGIQQFLSRSCDIAELERKACAFLKSIIICKCFPVFLLMCHEFEHVLYSLLGADEISDELLLILLGFTQNEASSVHLGQRTWILVHYPCQSDKRYLKAPD